MEPEVQEKLIVNRIHEKEVDALLKKWSLSVSEKTKTSLFVAFYIAPIHAFIPSGFLHELSQRGVAFNMEWEEEGNPREQGVVYCRYTAEGDVELKDVHDLQINPPLSEIQARIDSPKKLQEFCREHIKKVVPLPWDNQIEYGKLYCTKRLIAQHS